MAPQAAKIEMTVKHSVTALSPAAAREVLSVRTAALLMISMAAGRTSRTVLRARLALMTQMKVHKVQLVLAVPAKLTTQLKTNRIGPVPPAPAKLMRPKALSAWLLVAPASLLPTRAAVTLL